MYFSQPWHYKCWGGNIYTMQCKSCSFKVNFKYILFISFSVGILSYRCWGPGWYAGGGGGGWYGAGLW